MTNERIAVIGAGVAGLSAAWMLRERYDVHLLEQNDYLGGHTNTVVVNENRKDIPVDTGFIVYNEPNYPHLTALLRFLNVDTRASDMSFAVSIGDGEVEYSGSSIDTLYAQRRNLFSLEHQRMVWDILRFNRACARDLETDGFGVLNVDEYMARNRFSSVFRNRYLLPMAAAIWSCPTSVMGTYPMASLARFFDNHGLIKLSDRPQWRTIIGGSHQYVKRMRNDLGPNAHVNCKVAQVRRCPTHVDVELESGEQRTYSQVVLASHADQSLRMISDPSPQEADLLGQFNYQYNRAILHTDTNLMPRHRKTWSAWNYMADEEPRGDADRRVSVTYWMNRLQGIGSTRQYLVTLNPLIRPDPAQVLDEIDYHHPMFSEHAIAAQPQLSRLQGINRTWFCGSYFGYGFHEDALSSAVDVARALGVDPQWLSKPVSASSDAPVSLPLAVQTLGI